MAQDVLSLYRRRLFIILNYYYESDLYYVFSTYNGVIE